MAMRHEEDPTEFGRQPNGRYLPGHAEIKQVCAEIRSGWSEAERIKRHRWAQPVPVSSLREISMVVPTVGIFET